MEQLVKKTPVQTMIGLSLLFLYIETFEAAPQMFSKIMCIVLAFVGIIGAMKVYKKWKSGASDLQSAAITWFGSYLFLLVGNTVMLSVFGN